MKMIKLSDDHYVVADDSEIKKGDWIVFPNLKKFVPVQYLGGDLTGYEKKITHSTQPLEEWKSVSYGGDGTIRKKIYDKIKPLSLQEVKELLGVVDVEKKMISPYPMNTQNNVDWCNGYQRGYNQALEDNKDKVSLKDLKRFLAEGRYTISKDAGGNITADFTELISLLTSPKTEWDVEFVDGRLTLV